MARRHGADRCRLVPAPERRGPAGLEQALLTGQITLQDIQTAWGTLHATNDPAHMHTQTRQRAARFSIPCRWSCAGIASARCRDGICTSTRRSRDGKAVYPSAGRPSPSLDMLDGAHKKPRSAALRFDGCGQQIELQGGRAQTHRSARREEEGSAKRRINRASASGSTCVHRSREQPRLR